jgi:cell division septation protein DedD
VLQVHALRDAKVAKSIVQRLSRKGYPAYVVASGGSNSMYRVFVGRYKERSEAERIAARLKKEEQFDPWITR